MVPMHLSFYERRNASIHVQATRVRFRFGPDALEVVIGEQQDSSENAFVGGENKWSYSTFTNWEFWWPSFPVLVYFKVRKGFVFGALPRCTLISEPLSRRSFLPSIKDRIDCAQHAITALGTHVCTIPSSTVPNFVVFQLHGQF